MKDLFFFFGTYERFVLPPILLKNKAFLDFGGLYFKFLIAEVTCLIVLVTIYDFHDETKKCDSNCDAF